MLPLMVTLMLQGTILHCSTRVSSKIVLAYLRYPKAGWDLHTFSKNHWNTLGYVDYITMKFSITGEGPPVGVGRQIGNRQTNW